MSDWYFTDPSGRSVRRDNPDGSYDSRLLTDPEVAAWIKVGNKPKAFVVKETPPPPVVNRPVSEPIKIFAPVPEQKIPEMRDAPADPKLTQHIAQADVQTKPVEEISPKPVHRPVVMPIVTSRSGVRTGPSSNNVQEG